MLSFSLGVPEQEEAGPSSPQQPVKSYAKAVDPNAGQSFKIAQSTSELCPYYLMGFCRYGEECSYIHGDLCELCNQHCLHPKDEAQRLEHNQVTMANERQRDRDLNPLILLPISGLYAPAQGRHGEILRRGSFARQSLWNLHGNNLGKVALHQATFWITSKLFALFLVIESSDSYSFIAVNHFDSSTLSNPCVFILVWTAYANGDKRNSLKTR